jgi:hypothetical protein
MNEEQNTDQNINKVQKDNSFVSSKNLNELGLFKGKGHYIYIHQKSQKLVTAIYLITDFLKDNEPLKWKIREQGLSLLSRNLSLVNAFAADKKIILDAVSSVCLEIVSMIEIAYVAGVVSPMNFSILKKEFMDLVNLIETKENPTNLGSNFVLSESFLHVDAIKLEDDKGHNNVLENKMSFKPKILNSRFERRVPESKDKKTDRQAVILDVVRKKREVTIKDILAFVSDCGEKTIQRELLLMVSKGILKKVGERRWSRYSIQ